jgi:hypothetical protein
MWNIVKIGLLFAAMRLAVFALFVLVQLASPEASFLIFLDIPAFILIWGCSALLACRRESRTFGIAGFRGRSGCLVGALRRQKLFSSAPK